MMKIKKGDTVKVIAGSSKGKEAKVISVDHKNNKVVVEGVNVITKHEKPSASNPNGGIVTKEAPIDASNVMVVDGGQAGAVREGRFVNAGQTRRESDRGQTGAACKSGIAYTCHTVA